MSFSIVIPYHSNSNLLQICLETLIATIPLDAEIIIIANNPDKNVLDFSVPNNRCKVYKFQEELFYPKAMNIGVNIANGTNIIFCDADTSYTCGWFETLTSFYLSDPKIGLCSSKLINPLDRSIVDYGIGVTQFNCPHPFKGLSYTHALVSTNIEVQAACTANAIISKKLFQELGGFNELLVHSYSDIDLCQRIRKRGYSIWCVADSVVYHKGASTLGSSMSDNLKSDTKGIWGQVCASTLCVDMDKYINKSIQFLQTQNYTIQTGYYYIDLSTIADKKWYQNKIMSYLDSKCIDTYTRPFSVRDTTHISLYETIDVNIRNLSCPLLFFVDNFNSLKYNSLWDSLRQYDKDLIADRNANIVPYKEIAFK